MRALRGRGTEPRCSTFDPPNTTAGSFTGSSADNLIKGREQLKIKNGPIVSIVQILSLYTSSPLMTSINFTPNYKAFYVVSILNLAKKY
jgi:hypothetical protein